ncbi:MAG: hypothetical protein J5864_01405, partial [Oscillospiraceae bacterium]|nr:hypothetical protein [Oscillospiraceae bacterium]
FDGQTTIADEDLPAGFTTRKSKGFYFKNSGGFYDYTEKSDLITATNMGTDAIKISVAASLTECDDITLVDETEASFSWGNSAELSINLVEGDSDLLSSTTRGAISKDTDGNVVAATIDKNIDGITGTPTVNWNKTENKYEKTYTGVGESYSFYLQGAAGGNWSKVSDAAPKLDLTWIIKQDIGNADPGIDGGYNTTTKPLALSSTANTPLSLNLGAGDCEASGLTTLEFTQTAKPAFASVDLLAAANAGYVNIDVENSTLTFMKEFAADLKNAGITSGTVSLTFNNNKVVNNTTTPPSTSASTGSTATFTVTIN